MATEQSKIVIEVEVGGSKKTVSTLKEIQDAKKKLNEELKNSDLGSAEYKKAQEQLKKLNDEYKNLSSSTNALKKLRAELKEAQAAALNGDGKAAKRVAELKDQIEDLSDATKTLQGSGVERLGTSFNTLSEGISNFDTDKIKIGFEGLRQAMSAIPFLIVIQGIQLLIENFGELVDFFKSLSGGFTDAQRNLTALEKELSKTEKATADLSRELERENKLLEAQNGSQIKILDNQRKITEAQIESAEASKKLNEARLEEIKTSTTFFEKLTQVSDFLQGTNASEVVISEGRKKRSAEVQQALDEDNQKIKDGQNDLAVNAANKQKELNEMYKTARDLRIENIVEERKNELEQAKASYADALEENKNNAAALVQLHIKYKDDVLAINIKYDEIERQERKEFDAERTELQNNALLLFGQTKSQELEIIQTTADQELAIEEQTVQEIYGKRLANSERLRQLYIQEANEQIANSANSAAALQGLSDTVFSIRLANAVKGSKEEEKLAKQQFKINKALQISTAAINGAQAVTAILAVPDFTLGIASAIRIAAAVTTTAATIAKISATQFESPGSGSDAATVPSLSTPSLANTQAPTTQSQNRPQSNTLLDPSGNVLGGRQPLIKTYVLEQDVTRTQNRVNKLKSQSTFG